MLASILQWFQALEISLESNTLVSFSTKLLLIVLISILSNFIAKRILVAGLHKLIQITDTKWDDILVEKNVFVLLSHLAPAWVIYSGVFLAFPNQTQLVIWLQRLSMVYMIMVGVAVVNALLTALHDIYRTNKKNRKKPIKGYIQAIRIILYFIGGILSLSVLLDRSPWGFLSVFGGMTAVLILVFKDTILGFVASIQITSNDMVEVGDWIEMPKYGADGDVIDVSINTVKVQNWDKTITTIPTYSLVSNSFKNWRGMRLSGGRRIKRAVFIDMNTIRFCDEEMIKRFEKFKFLQDYLKRKTKELDEYNKEKGFSSSELINGRRMTNVGTFRAYVIEYLRQHPKIHNDMTFLVRQLNPTESGLPIEIYVFSNDQEWANYEAIQSDIFDHIFAVVPEFGLRVFQNPSGYDFRNFNPERKGVTAI